MPKSFGSWANGRRPVAQLNEALRIGEPSAGIHVMLAQMRLAMNDRLGARQDAELAIGMDPRLAAAWVARATIALAENDNQAALDDFHHAPRSVRPTTAIPDWRSPKSIAAWANRNGP